MLVGRRPNNLYPSFYFIVFKFIMLFCVKCSFILFGSVLSILLFLCVCYSCSGQNKASRNLWPFAVMSLIFATTRLCNRKRPRVLATTRICTKEKTVRTHCSEISTHCSECLRPDQTRIEWAEKMWQGQSRKLVRVENWSDQNGYKWSRTKMVMVDHTWPEQTRPD